MRAAADAGAEVRRGASVRAVRSGVLPTVTVEQEGRITELQARLVVAADGRASLTRKWAGFDLLRDPERQLFAGVLLANVPVTPDTWIEVMQPDLGQLVFFASVGHGRVRAYFSYPKDTHHRFQGEADLPRFITESLRTGAAADLFTNAHAIGALATFEADDIWVGHPYKAGVELIGDAAATCDPTFGQVLSLTLRSVRLLRDRLLGEE